MKRPKVTALIKKANKKRMRRINAINQLNNQPQEFCFDLGHFFKREIGWYKDRKWINRCRALYRSWRNSGKDRKFRHSVYAWYSWIVTKVYFEWERKEKGLCSEHIR